MPGIVLDCTKLARDYLPVVETSFNWAGYIPITVHRVSGGTRMVFGFAEMVSSVAASILVCNYGRLTRNSELRKEGWQLLDFAVHGVANIVRGFIECHAWIHLLCPLYDNFVPENVSENARLSYSRSIFKG